MISATTKTFFKVWKIEDKGKYKEVEMSSSRKDKRTDEYVSSSWRYVRFVGNANEKAEKLERGDRITNVSFVMDREPYEKDGEKVYPNSPRFVVFDFDMATTGSGGPKKKSASKNRDFDNEPSGYVDDGELPF